jgi:hypothetical protein
MILNAYAVLDSFVALLRLLAGLLVIGLGLTAWRATRRAAAPEERQALEDRGYLLSLLALLLLGLNVASWPLLYLLLQSYVPQWPGVMCVYGITRIGEGTVGASRFLPGLLAALQALKPAAVFVSGAWLVLYLLNRRTWTGALGDRVLLAAAACGLLAAADAATELTYLGIPKKEVRVSAGCCTGAFEVRSGFWGPLTAAVQAPAARPWLFAAYYAANGLMAAALWGWTRRPRPVRPLVLALLLLGALVALAAGGVFLVEVVAPAVLHLPYHHCPYDLIPGAPDVLAGAALLVWGTFAVGWACVAGWWGRGPEVAPLLPAALGRLLFMGFACYLASLVMMSVELALA